PAFEARFFMVSKSRAAWLSAWAVAGFQCLAAAAQTTAPAAGAAVVTARPDPADASAPVPSAIYRSPLTGYQAHAEPQVAPWRDSNDVVRQRGGWRAYAREARGPAAAGAPLADVPASAPTTAAPGHSGHEMK
ncbi:MAG: hypothetical protein QFE16_03025, partial [Pseudomonadota bacterium]|nr:hypothetical protein [Pseudomonadota bacterium]